MLARMDTFPESYWTGIFEFIFCTLLSSAIGPGANCLRVVADYTRLTRVDQSAAGRTEVAEIGCKLALETA